MRSRRALIKTTSDNESEWQRAAIESEMKRNGAVRNLMRKSQR
jgi:hypothetical protein